MSIKSIRSFYSDDHDNLWVAGYGGINKINLNTNAYKYFIADNDIEHALNNANIYVLAADKDEPGKTLWIGTEGTGINKINMQNDVVYKNPFGGLWMQGKISARIYSIVDDGKGNLWIGGNLGLDIINKKTGNVRNFRYDPNDSNSISPRAVTSIVIDDKGKYWIGTDLGGICYVDDSNFNFIKYSFDSKNPNSISNNFIKCIFEDSKNRLWIGTNGGGFNFFDSKTKTFKRYSIKDGLPNDVVYGILEDNSGCLWMSTNNGIAKFNPETGSFFSFDVHNGLQSNEFNTNAYYKNNSDEMFFGGVYGFNSFNPEKFKMNSNSPNVVLTEFDLFNKPVEYNQMIDGEIILNKSIETADEIDLDYDQNVFSIEFAALDFAAPQKNKYSYYLKGFDKKWSDPSLQRKVTYTNLSPGKYIFSVRGSNVDDVWTDSPATLIINIIPPFWQTWWFETLALLSGLGIIIGGYILRVRNINAQNELLEKEVKERTADLEKLNMELKKSEDELKELNMSKDKFFSILAHDLRGPFSGLMGLSEIILEDIEELDKNAIKDLAGDINHILHEQYLLLENLLDWSRIQLNKYNYEVEKIYLNEVIKRIKHFLYNNAKSKNISVEVNTSGDIYVAGNTTMLVSIIQNLVSNSIKFTNNGGKVIISANKNSHIAYVTVEDNGIGMDGITKGNLFKSGINVSKEGTDHEKGTGLGLMLVNEFIHKLGGSISVESEENMGTKFIFNLPLAN